MRVRFPQTLALLLAVIRGLGEESGGNAERPPKLDDGPTTVAPSAGLLHWWPDPVEGADRVTGRKGIRRGFGAVDEFPEVRLGYAPGWVELGPGITNRTFTLTVWVMEASRQTTPSMHTVISQDSGLGDGWVVRRFPSQVEFVSQSSAFLGQGARASMPVGWHFIAVRVDRGRSDLWLDGTAWVRSLSDSPDSGSPGPLCIGNNALGNSPWDGDIRDLRIFDRLLTDSEIVTLSRLPRSEPTQAPTASLRVAGQAVSVAPGRLGRYKIQKFTSDDSLPGANIQTLFQERNGALWVGSEHGLSRFDGRFFKPQDSVNAAFFTTGSNVRAIAEDTIGNLWFGLFDGIVQREQQHWRAYTNIGSARLIRCMAPAPDGTVWFAGNRHPAPRGRAQLRRLDPETGRLLVDTMVPGQVRDLRPAPGGLWIATDEPAGLWHFRETNGALEPLVHIAAVESVPHSSRFPFKPLARMATSARTNSIQVEVFQDQEGESQWAMVRIGTKGPLWSWTRKSDDNWRMVASSGDASFAEWIPEESGLLRRVGQSWERLNLGDPKSSSEVVAVSANAEGGIWAATRGDDLWLIQPRLVQMLTDEEGWSNEEVGSLRRSHDGRILIGGRSHTLARIDPRGIVPPESSPIRHAEGKKYGGELVAERADGSVVRTLLNAGTDGVYREKGINLGSFVFMSPDSLTLRLQSASQVHVAHDDTIWVVTEKGVFRIPDSGSFSDQWGIAALYPPKYSLLLDSLPDHVALHGLAEAPEGAIWIGSTGAGLFRIVNDQIEHFPAKDILARTPCVPLGFSGDGTLWLGSDEGLGIWRDGHYHWVKAINGLPEPSICDVEEAEGYVWLAGRRGVHGIRRADLEAFFAGAHDRVSPITLGRSDGFASTETNLKSQPVMAKTDDGQLWIGTALGVAHFHPSEVLARIRPPPIELEEFRVNRRPVVIGSDRLRLPPGSGRNVEIHFSSLSFVSPDKVTYEYQLSGPGGATDEDHGQTGQGFAVFTHLHPGQHAFRVWARSGNGLRSDPPARLEFTIEPYYFETPTFQAMAAFIGILLVAGVVGWRVRRHAAREQEARLHSERQRIARDMHDELGAELSRLALRTGTRYPGQDLCSGTQDSFAAPDARGLLRSLDETVWLVNPSKDTLDSMVNYLASWVRDYFKDTPVQVSLELPTAIPEVPVSAQWRHHMLRLVKEACHNIVKHAQATKVELTVIIHDRENSLELKLNDNGRGFELRLADATPDSQTDSARSSLGGNGIGNLHRRAYQLNGQLRLESSVGKGTRLQLTVPLPDR